MCVCVCLHKVNDQLCWTAASSSAICSYAEQGAFEWSSSHRNVCIIEHPLPTHTDTLKYAYTQRQTWRPSRYLECHVSRWGRPFGIYSSLTKKTCTWPGVTCFFPAFPCATDLASYLLLSLIKDQLALVQTCLLACLVVVNQWYWICDIFLKTFLQHTSWTNEH